MIELKEVRCNGVTKKGIPCTQLLGKINGSYEIKCHKCGKIHEYESMKSKELGLYMQELEDAAEKEDKLRGIVKMLDYKIFELTQENKQLLQDNTDSDIIDVE